MASPQNAATAETKLPEDHALLAHIRPYAQKKFSLAYIWCFRKVLTIAIYAS
jgi:hypothetical protein